MSRFVSAGLLALALAAAPAQACMWNPDEKSAFWGKPPETILPGEVVVEVGFAAMVRETDGSRFPGPRLDPDEGPFRTDCHGLTTTAAYSVRRVLKGDLDRDMIVVAPDFVVWDETFNPFAKRILVGTVKNAKEFTADLGSTERDAFRAPVLDLRVPPDEGKPSWLKSFFRTSAVIFFGSAYFTHAAISQALGASGPESGGVWIGLVVIAAIILAIATFVWLGLRRRRSRS